MPKVVLPAGWCRAVCIFVAITCVGVAADLLTKHWVFQALGMPGEYKAATNPELHHVYWIWQDIVGFQTSVNTGGLFGLGSKHTKAIAALSLIFLAGIIGYVLLWAWRSLFLTATLGMITAGICGNLYDRLGWHGLIYPEGWENQEGQSLTGQHVYAVRDWIHCMIGTFPWPNFNIADSLLVCSVILLLLHELWSAKPVAESKTHT
jgi:signal peptidase II